MSPGFRALVLSLGSLGPVAHVSAKKLVDIDAMRHDIQLVHKGNFDNIIGTSLPHTVSAVWYFDSTNQKDLDFLDVYNSIAKDYKKQLKIMAMDINGPNKAHADRLGVKAGETPHLRLYPQAPIPHFKYEGELTVEAIKKVLGKNMGSKIQNIDKVDDFTAWTKKNPTKTKVCLFSDKKKPPQMFKALSTDTVFARTVEFTFVGKVGTGEGEADKIAEAAGKHAKKTPVLMMISKGKTQWYGQKKNTDMSFLSIHEWINVNSESGMGDKVKDASGGEADEAEPIIEKVRELHGKNFGDLCFKQKNVCGIYLQDGDVLDDKIADQIQSFESAFEPKSDRGVKFSWMWADLSLQTDLKKVLVEQEKKLAEKEGRDEETLSLPTMIMVKPPRKKREEKFLSYVTLASGAKVTKESVKDLVEKVSGGATYQRGDVPKMIVRPQPKKDAKKKKEEL